LCAGPAAAQTTAGIDAGASYVEYDGFLGAAAFSLSPFLRAIGRRTLFAASASWLTFETGNMSLQGSLEGTYVLPLTSHLTAQFGGELGGSRYESFARLARALGRVGIRSRAVSGDGWLLATVGDAATDSGARLARRLDAGYRLRGGPIAVSLSATGTAVGDTAYADIAASVVYGRVGAFRAEASLSARAGDPGGNAGPYGEVALTIPLSGGTSFVLAGGRYPSDLVRGDVGAKYVTGAVRITAPFGHHARSISADLREPPIPEAAAVSATLDDVHCDAARMCTLVLQAGGASSVELTGDFTEWRAVPLHHAASGRWELTLRIAPGRHRFNVRVNGGRWGVPAGATPVPDDFQGWVGTLVVE
jgi:hypothetical protein